MKIKHVLATAAALAAVAVPTATTVFAATYTYAGTDQGFALVKDEKGNVIPGAEIKDGKADLTKYGLGVVETGTDSGLSDKEKEEIFTKPETEEDKKKAEEDKFIKDKGLDKDQEGNPSERVDETKPSTDKKDETKPSEDKKDETKKDETTTDSSKTTTKADDKKVAPTKAQKTAAKQEAAKVAKAAPANGQLKTLPNTAAVK